jgi:hypothetical protein
MIFIHGDDLNLKSQVFEFENKKIDAARQAFYGGGIDKNFTGRRFFALREIQKEDRSMERSVS